MATFQTSETAHYSFDPCIGEEAYDAVPESRGRVFAPIVDPRVSSTIRITGIRRGRTSIEIESRQPLASYSRAGSKI